MYLKNWIDNFFQIFSMGTSWVAISITNIKTRASREMTSRKNIQIFYFNGVNLPSTGMWRGEVFATSDCLVCYSYRSYLLILVKWVFMRLSQTYSLLLGTITIHSTVKQLGIPVMHPGYTQGWRGGRRSPAVACWASDNWIASSNPLRDMFRN